MPKKKPEKSLDELLEEALVKEDEHPYDVPGNWEFVRLGEVAQINPPKIRPEISDDKLCSFVPMKAVSDRLGIIENIEMKPFGKVKSGYTSFKENDVLFAKITPCMENGKVAIAKNLIDGFGYGTTEFFVLRRSNIVSNKFLYYIVRSQAFRDSAKPNMTGTVGQRRVPKAYLYNYKFPFPPLPEQKRIVKKLSSMIGKLKEAKGLIQEARDTFEERRAAILNKAFTGELTKKWREENPDVELELSKIQEIDKKPFDIPSSWKWARLQDVCSRIQYGTSAKSSKEGKVPVVRMGNIQNGIISWENLAYTSNVKEIDQYNLNYNDVLFNRTNSPALVGKTAIYKGEMPAIYAGYLIRVKPQDKLNADFLNFFLNSPYARYKCNRVKTDGVSQSNINSKKLGNFEVPLPPLDEQKGIVRILEKLLDHEDEARALIDMEEQIDLIEKSILSKAFCGELGTNDPNDEPAIELLKRSLKEKEKAA